MFITNRHKLKTLSKSKSTLQLLNILWTEYEIKRHDRDKKILNVATMNKNTTKALLRWN